MRSNLESDHREEVFCCVEWGARAYFLSLKHCWLPTIVSHTRVFKKIHFSRHHRENLKLFKGISISRISWVRLFLTRTQEWRKSTTQKTQKQAHASYKAKDMNAQTSISSSTMKSLTFDLKENVFHSWPNSFAVFAEKKWSFPSSKGKFYHGEVKRWKKFDFTEEELQEIERIWKMRLMSKNGCGISNDQVQKGKGGNEDSLSKLRSEFHYGFKGVFLWKKVSCLNRCRKFWRVEGSFGE